MPKCRRCGRECRTRFLDYEKPAAERLWECADCIGLSPDSTAVRVAETIAQHQADGTLADYPLAQRLADLKGGKIQ